MESSVESFILRFRDLSTSPGQTIEKHSEIVRRTGCVYWGWWAKSGEAVPVATFALLYRRLKRGELFKCYLFDSGVIEGESLYEVQCGDIDWHKDLSPAPSPQPDATPAYYSDRACQAWFKLTSVPERIDSSLLRGWSYVEVDEFFQSGESPYGSFAGKQVSSTRELQQQNRTIWFIKPFDEAKDETHEILLTDPRRLEPEDFSSQYRTATGDCLLWLSDLHFSIDGHHGVPPVVRGFANRFRL